MRLKNIEIRGIDTFHEYFDFRELYELLCSEDVYVFGEFARPELAKRKWIPLLNVLFGINSFDGTEQKDALCAVNCVRNPADCVRLARPFSPGKPIFEAVDRDAASPVLRLYEPEQFAVEMEVMSQVPCDHLFCKSDERKSMGESIRKAVMDVTENGKRHLSPEAAAELYIYFLLHAFAAVPPDRSESLEALRADMDRLCPILGDSLLDKSVFPLYGKDGEAVFSMEAFSGTEPNGDPLSIIELQNKTDHLLRIDIGGTVLSRLVPAYDSVYAIRRGAQFVAFLPRFRINGEIAIVRDGGSLYSEWRGTRQIIKTSIPRPAICVQSGMYGTFVVDSDGKLDEESSWPEDAPKLPVVSVDAFGQDYCFILCDGSVLSLIPKRGWTDMLYARIDRGGSIGIDSSRSPILDDGTRVAPIQAVDARICDGHFVCMDAHGQIAADIGLHLDQCVYAIAVCGGGYLFALKEKVCMYSFWGSLLRSWDISGVTELEACDTAFFYYDAEERGVRMIPFGG